MIDPRWVVPVPRSVIELSAAGTASWSAIEDGIKVGGIGTRIRQDLREAGVDTAVTELGLPDEFLDHATRAQIMQDIGLTAPQVAEDIAAMFAGSKVPHVGPPTAAIPTIASPRP